MEDIVYFRSTIEPEAPEGPVGWTIADSLRQVLQLSGIDVGPVKPFWDGVRFFCVVRRCRFEVAVTPYFEAKPLEWSVQVGRKGFLRLVAPVWRPCHETLVDRLNRWLSSDERFTLIRWDSLADLEREQRRRTSG
jgi:hypothetical protein